jgi:hypothetical protein
MSVRIARMILTGLSKSKMSIFMQRYSQSASGLRKMATSVLAKAKVKGPRSYKKPKGIGGMAERQAKKAANPKFKSTRSEREGQLLEKPLVNTQIKRRKRTPQPQDDYYKKYRPGTRERDLD